MTDDELSDIAARANAATPGPWRVGHYGVETDDDVICDLFDNSGDDTLVLPDCIFIANSIMDIPALIAEVRRLQEVNAHLTCNTDCKAGWEAAAAACDDRDKALDEVDRLRKGILKAIEEDVRQWAPRSPDDDYPTWCVHFVPYDHGCDACKAEYLQYLLKEPQQ